jgi:hypothetical protein
VVRFCNTNIKTRQTGEDYIIYTIAVSEINSELIIKVTASVITGGNPYLNRKHQTSQLLCKQDLRLTASCT